MDKGEVVTGLSDKRATLLCCVFVLLRFFKTPAVFSCVPAVSVVCCTWLLRPLQEWLLSSPEQAVRQES